MVSNKHLFIFFFLITLIPFLFPTPTATASPNITAIFAFGDSILDPGNNNALPTLCKSNHPPYGTNFPGHVPSGRFTDGILFTDYLVSDLFHIKQLLPAYLDRATTDRDLLTGVSFASACTGLDDLTATEAGVLSFTRQLGYFQQALERIRRAVGQQEADQIVENALFIIGAGTNDMVDNFYDLPLRRTYSLSSYQDLLLTNLESVIQRLHGMGARKIAVMGLPPVGCLPVQVTIGSFLPSLHMFRRVCMTEYNSDSQAYNSKLQSHLSRLQATLPGSKVVYTDIFTPIMDMVSRPSAYGMDTTLEGCCGTGSMEMGPLCGGLSPTCPNPSSHLFWDAVHPTQAAYRILAQRFQHDVLPRLVS